MTGILNPVPDAAAEFSSSAVLPTLRAACERAGIDCNGAELLRLGENAIFQLASAPVVVRFARSQGPIHGDAHTRNLLTDHGQVVLLDFESAAIGPREWDLLPTAIARERYGLAEKQYQEFATAYGFDVRSWPGYPVLREIRQLTMTTWIMQNIGESPAAAAEFALRVASLKERDFERAWNFF